MSITKRIFLGGMAALALREVLRPLVKEDGGHSSPSKPLPPKSLPEPILDGKSVTTEAFDELSQQFKWLNDIGKSVGKIHVSGKDVAATGSVVLLDRQGTLAFCQHEVGHFDMFRVQFINKESNSYSELQTIEIIDADQSIDIAFGRISPHLVAKLGLQPIKWGQQDITENAQDIAVGFSLGGGLDARLGQHLTYTSSYEEQNITGVELHKCAFEEDGESYRGMSGGAWLDGNGIFKGIQKAMGVGFRISTPASAIANAYIKFFPERAKHNGLILRQSLPGHGECVFHGQHPLQDGVALLDRKLKYAAPKVPKLSIKPSRIRPPSILLP